MASKLKHYQPYLPGSIAFEGTCDLCLQFLFQTFFFSFILMNESYRQSESLKIPLNLSLVIRYSYRKILLLKKGCPKRTARKTDCSSRSLYNPQLLYIRFPVNRQRASFSCDIPYGKGILLLQFDRDQTL